MKKTQIPKHLSKIENIYEFAISLSKSLNITSVGDM